LEPAISTGVGRTTHDSLVSRQEKRRIESATDDFNRGETVNRKLKGRVPVRREEADGGIFTGRQVNPSKPQSFAQTNGTSGP